MPDENANTIEQTIIEAAKKAKSVQVDGMRVENQSLPELIAADKYLQQKKAEGSKQLPIRFVKIEPK